jgi:chromosome segregation ATPase
VAIDLKSEFQRPVPIALAGAAVLGWLLAINGWWSASSGRAESAQKIEEISAKLADTEAARQKLSGDLDEQQKAAGSVADLKKKLEATNADLETTTTAQQAAAQKLDATTKDLATAQQTLGETSAKAAAATDVLNTTSGQTHVAEDRMAQLERDYAALREKFDARATQLADAQKAAEAAVAAEMQARANTVDLIALAQSHTAEILSLRDAEREAWTANTTVQTQLTATGAALTADEARESTVRDSLGTLEGQLNLAEQRFDGLKADYTALRQKFEERTHELAEASEKLAAARADELSARGNVTDLIAQGQSMSSEVMDLQRTTKEAWAANTAAQTELTASRGAIAEARQGAASSAEELKAIRQKIAEAEKASAEARSAREDAELALKQKQAQLAELGKQITELTETQATRKRAVAALDDQRASTERRLADLQAKAKDAKAEFDASVQAKASAEAQVRALQQQIDSARQSVAAAANARDQMQASLIQVRQTAQETSELLAKTSENVAARNREVGALEAQIQSVRDEVGRLGAARKSAESDLDTVQQQIAEATKDRDAMLAQNQELQRKTADADQLLAKLGDEISTRQSQLIDLDAQRQAAQQQIADSQAKLAKLLADIAARSAAGESDKSATPPEDTSTEPQKQ